MTKDPLLGIINEIGEMQVHGGFLITGIYLPRTRFALLDLI